MAENSRGFGQNKHQNTAINYTKSASTITVFFNEVIYIEFSEKERLKWQKT